MKTMPIRLLLGGAVLLAGLSFGGAAEAVCIRNQLAEPVRASVAGAYAWEARILPGYELCTERMLDADSIARAKGKRLAMSIVSDVTAGLRYCNGTVKHAALVMLYVERDGRTMRCDAY
ncbi:MAG: hypothetical protein RIB55_04960 [Nitratireductor sp.]